MTLMTMTHATQKKNKKKLGKHSKTATKYSYLCNVKMRKAEGGR